MVGVLPLGVDFLGGGSILGWVRRIVPGKRREYYEGAAQYLRIFYMNCGKLE